jgi:hypothetical protein
MVKARSLLASGLWTPLGSYCLVAAHSTRLQLPQLQGWSPLMRLHGLQARHTGEISGHIRSDLQCSTWLTEGLYRPSERNCEGRDCASHSGGLSANDCVVPSMESLAHSLEHVNAVYLSIAL